MAARKKAKKKTTKTKKKTKKKATKKTTKKTTKKAKSKLPAKRGEAALVEALTNEPSVRAAWIKDYRKVLAGFGLDALPDLRKLFSKKQLFMFTPWPPLWADPTGVGSCSPNPIPAGSPQSFTLAGQNFEDGFKVVFVHTDQKTHFRVPATNVKTIKDDEITGVVEFADEHRGKLFDIGVGREDDELGSVSIDGLNVS
jgi:hypothetical protein